MTETCIGSTVENRTQEKTKLRGRCDIVIELHSTQLNVKIEVKLHPTNHALATNETHRLESYHFAPIYDY
jgi:hypothetical protein